MRMSRFAAFLSALLLFASCGSRSVSDGYKGRVLILTDSLLEAGGRDTVRLGRLHSGEVAVVRISFLNRSSRSLLLSSYERSCGCTSLAFDGAPFAPGDFRSVELSFDSRGERGWQFKTVDLFFAPAGRFRLFVDADVE